MLLALEQRVEQVCVAHRRRRGHDERRVLCLEVRLLWNLVRRDDGAPFGPRARLGDVRVVVHRVARRQSHLGPVLLDQVTQGHVKLSAASLVGGAAHAPDERHEEERFDELGHGLDLGLVSLGVGLGVRVDHVRQEEAVDQAHHAHDCVGHHGRDGLTHLKTQQLGHRHDVLVEQGGERRRVLVEWVLERL